MVVVVDDHIPESTSGWSRDSINIRAGWLAGKDLATE